MLRSARNYDRDAVSLETGLSIDPAENRTQQQFKDDADINTIVKRFGLTGKLPVLPDMPMVGDFTEVTDFHTAMNVVRKAQEEFARIPSDLRKRFGDDPAQLMEFMYDEANREEAIKLGLIAAPAERDRIGDVVPGQA